MRSAWIKSQAGSCSVKALCQVLKVRRRGYYAWKRPRSSDRKGEATRLDEAIRRQFEAHKGRYGAPRVTEELKAEGWRVGRPRVAKRMQALGLKARAARKDKATTQSKHNLPVAPTRLQPAFTASAPNQKWVSDITYLWTGEGWLYLAGMLDLYSRAVVGWSMGERLSRDLVIQALTMASWRRRPKAGLIAHSDQGSQYASNAYPRLLNSQGFLCSMSRKGDCYDNAAMESFFHALKIEQPEGMRYATREEAKADVFEYIESYYNRKRRHSTLNYLSPCDFETRMAA